MNKTLYFIQAYQFLFYIANFIIIEEKIFILLIIKGSFLEKFTMLIFSHLSAHPIPLWAGKYLYTYLRTEGVILLTIGFICISITIERLIKLENIEKRLLKDRYINTTWGLDVLI